MRKVICVVFLFPIYCFSFYEKGGGDQIMGEIAEAVSEVSCVDNKSLSLYELLESSPEASIWTYYQEQQVGINNNGSWVDLLDVLITYFGEYPSCLLDIVRAGVIDTTPGFYRNDRSMMLFRLITHIKFLLTPAGKDFKVIKVNDYDCSSRSELVEQLITRFDGACGEILKAGKFDHSDYVGLLPFKRSSFCGEMSLLLLENAFANSLIDSVEINLNRSDFCDFFYSDDMVVCLEKEELKSVDGLDSKLVSGWISIADVCQENHMKQDEVVSSFYKVDDSSKLIFPRRKSFSDGDLEKMGFEPFFDDDKLWGIKSKQARSILAMEVVDSNHSVDKLNFCLFCLLAEVEQSKYSFHRDKKGSDFFIGSPAYILGRKAYAKVGGSVNSLRETHEEIYEIDEDGRELCCHIPRKRIKDWAGMLDYDFVLDSLAFDFRLKDGRMKNNEYYKKLKVMEGDIKKRFESVRDYEEMFKDLSLRDKPDQYECEFKAGEGVGQESFNVLEASGFSGNNLCENVLVVFSTIEGEGGDAGLRIKKTEELILGLQKKYSDKLNVKHEKVALADLAENKSVEKIMGDMFRLMQKYLAENSKTCFVFLCGQHFLSDKAYEMFLQKVSAGNILYADTVRGRDFSRKLMLYSMGSTCFLDSLIIDDVLPDFTYGSLNNNRMVRHLTELLGKLTSLRNACD